MSNRTLWFWRITLPLTATTATALGGITLAYGSNTQALAVIPLYILIMGWVIEKIVEIDNKLDQENRDRPH